MKSIIVGTAGHIDHGKTALVKALTGIDADRLAEEKRRGITIDLGFAHMDLPTANTAETLRLGFVDVPGHERFIRNMLAGVGGIDLVLLVIAADEAIKPQTREHFEILQLLGVQRGITVLTKSDTVDEETLGVVRLEVEDFLRGTFLESPASPIVAVSALTGAGLSDLKHAITIKGFGTVVTGTLIAGTIRREGELEIFPSRRPVRVRGMQVHSQHVDAVVAGQRTALNLAGASTEDISRGMTLVPPNTFETTRQADVQMRLLASAPRALKNRARVHFHSYTMETVVEVKLRAKATHSTAATEAEAAGPQLQPGQDAFARLKFPEPILLLPGDRFILRQFSPVVTIAGGVVLDAAPIPRMKSDSNFLDLLASGDAASKLQARIARRQHEGILLSRLVAETGWTKDTIEAQLAPALRTGAVRRIGTRFLHSPSVHALKNHIVNAAALFHKNNPLVAGINKEELRSQVNVSQEIFEAVAAELIREKKIEINGDLVRLPGLGVVMKDEEAESKKKIEDAFFVAGLKVPALQDVLNGLKVDKTRAQKIVTLLLRDKILIKVSDDLVFHRNALEALRRQLTDYKQKARKIDVANFKDLIGVTRKYAIPLLEYLDRERVTRRVGDAREIL